MRPVCPRARIVTGALLAAFGCDRPVPAPGQPNAVAPSAPSSSPGRVEVGGTLPELSLGGVDGTAELRVDLHALLDESRGELVALVVSGGAWCGTCQWIAERGPKAFGAAEDRVYRIDVILGDRDNAPADSQAAGRFRDAYPALHGGVVLADPTDRLRPAAGGRTAMLPRVLVVDPSTRQLVDVMSNPSPAELEHRLQTAVAKRNGSPPPPEPAAEPRVDGLFLPHEWELLSRTGVPERPPFDASNAVADSPEAAAFGRALFFDAGLSGAGTSSCASCHQPDRALSDGKPRAQAAGQGDRRTPSIALAAHARWQFWDGRADSLWAQALGPIEAENELDGSRVAVARRVLEHHAQAYRAAFPEAPSPDPGGWPLAGKPGEPAYDDLPVEVRDAVTRVFVDAGKAIAAWERTLRVEPNRLDAYLSGEAEALEPAERYGLHLFVRQGCVQCHWGPRLTDDAFHAVALSNPLASPDARMHASADPGRGRGLLDWAVSEFRRDGRWSDDARASLQQGGQGPATHQFKTPALRGVADGSHWGHAGQFDQLAGVTEAYGNPPLDPAMAREAWVPTFGETVQWGLVPFLELLTAEPRGGAWGAGVTG